LSGLALAELIGGSGCACFWHFCDGSNVCLQDKIGHPIEVAERQFVLASLTLNLISEPDQRLSRVAAICHSPDGSRLL
jgi:hypothetical protein